MRPFGVCVPTDNLLSFPVGSAVLDLSKATKLKDATFWPTFLSVGWITAAIQTTTPKHQELRKISICDPYSLTLFDVGTMKESAVHREWLNLDRLLVQLSESRSTPPRVICTTWLGHMESMIGFADCLLPELTRKGLLTYVDNM